MDSFLLFCPFLITQVKFKQEKASRLLLKKVFSLVASFAVVGVLLLLTMSISLQYFVSIVI